MELQDPQKQTDWYKKTDDIEGIGYIERRLSYKTQIRDKEASGGGWGFTKLHIVNVGTRTAWITAGTTKTVSYTAPKAGFLVIAYEDWYSNGTAIARVSTGGVGVAMGGTTASSSNTRAYNTITYAIPAGEITFSGSMYSGYTGSDMYRIELLTFFYFE